MEPSHNKTTKLIKMQDETQDRSFAGSPLYSMSVD